MNDNSRVGVGELNRMRRFGYYLQKKYLLCSGFEQRGTTYCKFVSDITLNKIDLIRCNFPS